MKWEYLNVIVETGSFFGGPKPITDDLNKYGEKGWELVNFQYIYRDDSMCLVFKRPIIKSDLKENNK